MARPALLRWITWTRTKKLKTRPPTAEDGSSEDEKPAPEDGGTNTRPSDKHVWRALGRWWELKSWFV
jgi:hypothetical protein